MTYAASLRRRTIPEKLPLLGGHDPAHLQQALLEVATALNKQLDRDEVLRCISAQLAPLIPFSELTIARADRADRVVVPVFHQGTFAAETLALRLPFGVGITGRCAATGLPVIWNGGPHGSPDAAGYQIPGTPHEPEERLMAVPLMGPDGVDGCLTVYRDSERFGPFLPEDREVAELFAAQAQIAFRNAELFAEAADRAKRLQALNRLLRSTSQSLDLQTIFDGYAEALGDLVPFDYATAVIRGADGDVVVAWGTSAGDERPEPLPPTSGANWVLEHDTGYVVGDLQSNEKYGSHQRFLTAGCRSVLAAPLVARGVTFGALGLGHSTTNFYDERSFELFQEAALQISAGVDNALLHSRLQHQAFHDTLTGLPNRAVLRDRVERALLRSERSRALLAVLFLDLDDFKVVNDTIGHAAGDQLLVEVGKRITACLRPSDTAARLGGDEFAVLLEDIPDATAATDLATRIISSVAAPMQLEGREIRPATSIGIATSGGGESTDTLLRNADVAMYEAKSRGKGRFEIFHVGLHAVAMHRVGLRADLRRALDEMQLVLHYQPIVDLRSGQVVGEEALLRWNHPERGLILPGEFIPAAEDSGLIVPIGRMVLRDACSQVAEWQREFPDRTHNISVNISARQFVEGALVGDVASALTDSGLEPEQLILELTETLLMQDTTVTVDTLRALKLLGVRIAIDDFGTGYSSLSYLRRFPVDILKIDRSFVAGIARGIEDSALARAIVQLGRTLHMQTLAEGVEMRVELEMLQSLGCQLGQGYYFARPMDADAFGRLLREGRQSWPLGKP